MAGSCPARTHRTVLRVLSIDGYPLAIATRVPSVAFAMNTLYSAWLFSALLKVSVWLAVMLTPVAASTGVLEERARAE